MESIELGSLGKRISEEVESYSEKVLDDALERLDKTADEILDYIKSNAPRGKHSEHLADSFTKKTYGEGKNKTIVIYSETKGSIVHLIELGFKHRSGKLVPARPFLRPAYDEFTPKMIEDIKRIIKGGS